MSYQTLKQKTDQFLACETIAVIGVSKKSELEAANGNYKRLKEAGYKVIPVNPKYDEFEGEKCYSHVTELRGQVDAALVFTPPAVTPQVVKECFRAGIKNIWVHKAFGQGSHSEEAALFFKDKPWINFIDGACPLMFIQDADWFHRGFKNVLRWTGGLPA